jgi:LacI family transcriptional regulator
MMALMAGKQGRGKTVTLREVAARAGVTAMTVSNVLNGRGAVGTGTRARVLAAVETLHYRPHAGARRLRAKRFEALGMLVLDDAPDYLSDPFTTQIVAGLGNFATEHGQSLVLQGVRRATLEQAPLLSQLETDGVCALLSGDARERAALVERLQRLRVPLVLFQEPAGRGDVCAIRQDDRGGAAALARLVAEKGAKRIMMLLPRVEWPAMVAREAGAREAAAAAGASLRAVRCADEGFEATQAALRKAIAAHGLPQAILGGNDRMAIAALKLLEGMGVRVPQQVRVTGFNGFDVAQYSSPALTTMRSPAYEMGWRGGAALLQRLESGRFAEKEIVLPVAFVAGGST